MKKGRQLSFIRKLSHSLAMVSITLIHVDEDGVELKWSTWALGEDEQAAMKAWRAQNPIVAESYHAHTLVASYVPGEDQAPKEEPEDAWNKKPGRQKTY